jgi:polyphosphate glucokinase
MGAVTNAVKGSNGAKAATEPTVVLGVDIGGSGIKAAPVNVVTGELLAERHRIETPQPATPAAVVDTVAALAKHFQWDGAIGVGFPAVIKAGEVFTAANIDKKWIGHNAEKSIAEATGSKHVRVMNDADVAGMAEMRFGAGRNETGLVLMVTLGTGIGTALFMSGMLVPNTELGHIEMNGGKEAEAYAADSAREREDLGWKEWAERVDKYLITMESLFWPDLIIVGGGVSKKADKFLPLLTLKSRVLPAALRNEAGIVGAALAAAP